MNAALATLPLMLRHELRLSWRPMAARTSSKVLIGSVIGFAVLMHLVALPFPFVVEEVGSIDRLTVLAGVSGMGLLAVVMMTSLALISTVQLLYSRSDMDLLLSSPIPPQSIVFVRLLTIALGVLGIAAMFTLPFANVMAVFGYPRFLVAYLVLLCIGLTATAFGVLLAQGLFSLLGPRRTRLFAQIFAGLIGIAVIFAANFNNLMPETARGLGMHSLDGLMAHLPGADSWVWLPARAMIGEPLPFLIGVLLCGAFFVVTSFGLADRLLANAIAANGNVATGIRNRSSRLLSPRSGPTAVMRRKEWVLIGRDPWLMSQIAMQLLVMLPAAFLVAKGGSAAYLWLIVVFLCGHLAGALAWLTVSTEESPDLLATAPVLRRNVLLAKVQAALIPTAALAAVPIAVAFWLAPWVGFTILVCSAGSAFTAAMLHVTHPGQAKRSELGWRGNSNKMVGIVEMLLGLMWVVFGVLMLLFGWWGLLAVLVPLPFALWSLRRR